eukprot:Phypoly_transcript_26534.p2 GENE.Phypoly_transcript_26534~~Phypoly_transcript_26534.p2  ORF type:complete len:112 (+),score=26.84 Phypoly_transcript_26534:122-457(+)
MCSDSPLTPSPPPPTPPLSIHILFPSTTPPFCTAPSCTSLMHTTLHTLTHPHTNTPTLIFKHPSSSQHFPLSPKSIYFLFNNYNKESSACQTQTVPPSLHSTGLCMPNQRP